MEDGSNNTDKLLSCLQTSDYRAVSSAELVRQQTNTSMDLMFVLTMGVDFMSEGASTFLQECKYDGCVFQGSL